MTSRCTHKAERQGGQRYCRACRRAYMRDYRDKLKASRLHAVVERRVLHASRETEGGRP